MGDDGEASVEDKCQNHDFYATRWLVVLITDIGYSGRALHLVDVLDIFHLPFSIHSLCFFILLSTLGG